MWFLFKLSNKLFFYKGKDYMPSCFKSAEKSLSLQKQSYVTYYGIRN